MSAFSTIQWTDATWNPTRGCTEISAGCAHCYAKSFAERFRGVAGHAYERGFDPRPAHDQVTEPLLWAKPRRVFVNSMSDLFHDAFEEDYLVKIGRVMEAANWHDYQILTKRPDRMRRLLQGKLAFAAALPHVWWGVSVENNRHGLPRIGILRQTPAHGRFLSIEPLLENLEPMDLTGIDLVIVGGESGRRARPILRSWVRTIRDQCQAQRIRFFFKQWGGTRPGLTGRVLDGRTHDDLPPHLQRPVPPPCERQAVADRLRSL